MEIAAFHIAILAEIAGLDIASIGALPHSLPVPSFPSTDHFDALFSAAFAVAVLATLESLLSAKVADGRCRIRMPRSAQAATLFPALLSPITGRDPIAAKVSERLTLKGPCTCP